jgi:hypothetical protein
MKTSNITHGYIRATIDINAGPTPMSVLGYYARTLNDKRSVNNYEQHIVDMLFSRRDFRLVIGDPNHPGKAMANPVIWLKKAVTVEVSRIVILTRTVSPLSMICDTCSCLSLVGNCQYTGLFVNFRQSHKWLASVLHSS